MTTSAFWIRISSRSKRIRLSLEKLAATLTALKSASHAVVKLCSFVLASVCYGADRLGERRVSG